MLKSPVKEAEVSSTPVPKMVTLSAKLINNNNGGRTNEAFSPSTPTPSKQILENNRKKRRSSFAAAAVQSSVRNSFGATVTTTANPGTTTTNLQSQLLPENVKTGEYHRHIQTDLPGPVKMRQLMIWACQKAAKETNNSNVNTNLVNELVNGLLSNTITTSWYQRPINNTPTSDAVYYLPNPQNQEISECIELYKNYHQKLEKECEIWEELKSKTTINIVKNQKMINSDSVKIDNTLNVLFAEEFQNLSKWLNSLPLSIDRLDWNTKLALSFQDHAKQFCEGVFHQIFAKFFSADLPQRGKAQRIEPMMILRALSTNQTISQ